MEQHLPDWILHCNAADATETSPLSADVYAIRGKSAWWIFDVGANDAAVNFREKLLPLIFRHKIKSRSSKSAKEKAKIFAAKA